MNKIFIVERFCLIGHIISMVFGLAGMLLIMPNADIILNLSAIGQTIMQFGLVGGGTVYMIFGAIAVFLYAYRLIGLVRALCFLLPSLLISLSSELLGTSTGFPFGHYSYLSGLGYKIAGLVPFTIPLSWFYLGFVSYLIARVGLQVDQKPSWLRHTGAIALGALLLTSWDFVLDPAMSQTSFPFWYWHQPGAFFGMPYQNFIGWMGTGALFMTVSALLWGKIPLKLDQSSLNPALLVYLSNFAFAAVMSLSAGFPIPLLLGLIVGVTPAIYLWFRGSRTKTSFTTQPEHQVKSVEVAFK
jgi:putative membrane protein